MTKLPSIMNRGSCWWPASLRRALLAAGAKKPKLLDQLRQTLRSRYPFATHVLEYGFDIRTIEELRGHKDLWTTIIPTNVLNKGGRSLRSPLMGCEPFLRTQYNHC